MKLLCLVLSFVVLMMSARPCCANDDCGDDEAKQEQSDKQSAHDHGGECQGCSPFFTCGACVGFVLSKPPASVESVILERIQRIEPPYNQPGLKEVAIDIWQPPKLS